MLNRIFNTTKTLVNTDGNGNFRPSDFDLIVYSVVVELYEEMFDNGTRLVNRSNRGLIGVDLENALENNREKIEFYLEPDTLLNYANGVFEIPTDARYFDLLHYNNVEIEKLKSTREFNAISEDVGIEYPVTINIGRTFKVAPDSIVEDVKLSYLRNPKRNKWTYMILNGTEVFNPDANDFQDIDIHPSQESALLIKVLEKHGINLKERELQEVTQRHMAQDFNEKITN